MNSSNQMHIISPFLWDQQKNVGFNILDTSCCRVALRLNSDTLSQARARSVDEQSPSCSGNASALLTGTNAMAATCCLNVAAKCIFMFTWIPYSWKHKMSRSNELSCSTWDLPVEPFLCASSRARESKRLSQSRAKHWVHKPVKLFTLPHSHAKPSVPRRTSK